MLWPKKDSYKVFDNEKKFLRLENSSPPHNFPNGRSLSGRSPGGLLCEDFFPHASGALLSIAITLLPIIKNISGRHPTSIFGKYLFGRSRIFGTFVVKFLACLPLLGFSNI